MNRGEEITESEQQAELDIHPEGLDVRACCHCIGYNTAVPDMDKCFLPTPAQLLVELMLLLSFPNGRFWLLVHLVLWNMYF